VVHAFTARLFKNQTFQEKILDNPSYRLEPGEEERYFATDRQQTFSNYDFSEAPDLNRDVLQGFASGALVKNGENMLLLGGAGTGKTHLWFAIAHGVASQNMTVRLITEVCGDISYHLCEPVSLADCHKPDYDWQALCSPPLRRDLLNCDLLIVDELPRLFFGGYTEFTDLLMQRLKANRSTIIATRLWPDKIVKQEMFDDHIKRRSSCWMDLKHCVGDLFRVGTSANFLLQLGVGVYLDPDSPSSVYFRDTYVKVPAEQTDAYAGLNLARRSWVDTTPWTDPDGHLDLELFPPHLAGRPEWHIFQMKQKSYRLRQAWQEANAGDAEPVVSGEAVSGV
jgi:hypothetical protein